MEVSVKVTARPRIEVPDLTAENLRSVGAVAEQKIESRVDSASPRDVRGRPAPPLRPSYQQRKLRRGLRGVRDLHLTGELLAEMGVYRARKGYVYVGFRSSKQYMKGLRQQQKYEWFGLSDTEEAAVVQHAQGLFADQVKQFGSIGS